MAVAKQSMAGREGLAERGLLATTAKVVKPSKRLSTSSLNQDTRADNNNLTLAYITTSSSP